MFLANETKDFKESWGNSGSELPSPTFCERSPLRSESSSQVYLVRPWKPPRKFLHSLSGQPVTMPHCPHGEKLFVCLFFPLTCSQNLLGWFSPVATCPPTVACQKEPGSISWTISSQVLAGCCLDLLRPFLKLNKPSFLTFSREVLQSP